MIETEEASAQPPLSDAEIVRRIADGDRASFETLMRRFNRKLFRIARAILKDDAEAEEALTTGKLLVKKSGRFAYVCTLHPTMKGALSVK